MLLCRLPPPPSPLLLSPLSWVSGVVILAACGVAVASDLVAPPCGWKGGEVVTRPPLRLVQDDVQISTPGMADQLKGSPQSPHRGTPPWPQAAITRPQLPSRSLYHPALEVGTRGRGQR